MPTSGLCGQKPFTVHEGSTLTVEEPQEAEKAAKRAEAGPREPSPPGAPSLERPALRQGCGLYVALTLNRDLKCVATWA